MNTAEREHDPVLRDRVGRLMTFLRELVAAKTRPVYRVEQHPEHYWLGEAVGFAQFRTAAVAGEVVLRAPRVLVEPPPELPGLLQGWVDPRERDDSRVTRPALRETGPRPGDTGGAPVALTELPEITAAYHQWLPTWQGWAEVDRQRRPQFELYEALRRMRQQQLDQPESLELVLAAGLLQLPGSPTDGVEPVSTHLVAQPVVVDLDVETGDLLCTFAADSAARLEDSQLLTGHPLFDPSGTTHLRDQLAAAVVSPLDPELLAFLKEWAQRACTTQVEVGDDSAELTTPCLRPAPALVLRRRGAFALLDYYDQMIAAAAQEDVPVPLGIAQLVEAIEAEERLAWLERTSTSQATDLARDPLFPLPANEEQAQIITRLGGDSGVVVEGPPGTGKTHTIANLVSALLADGQRILVTSEKAQALRVLRDKLPPQMQELCVSITDIARGGSAELNRSVASLAARKAGFNAAAEDRQIQNLAQRRDEINAQRAHTLEEIRALREQETYQHPEVAPGYAGTAAAIAQRVTAARPRLGWLPTPVHGDLPLTATEFARLRALLESDSAQRQGRAAQCLPAPEVIPDQSTVTGLAARLHRGQQAHAAASAAMRELVEQDGVDLLQLADVLRTVATQLDAVHNGPAWASTLAEDLLAGRNSYLWERAAGYRQFAAAARDADRFLGLTRIEGVEDPSEPMRRAFTALADYLAAGGAVKKLFKNEAQKAAEPWLGSVRVADQPVTTADQARRLQAHLDVYGHARAMQDLLQQLAVPVPVAGPRPALVGQLLELTETLDTVTALTQAVDRLHQALAQQMQQPPPLTSLERVHTVTLEASALVAAHDAALARADLSRLAAAVEESLPAGHPAPEVATLVETLRRGDADGFDQARAAVQAARGQQADQREQRELADRLAAGSLGLLRLLEQDPGAETWTARIDDWQAAWAWATAASWLQQQSDPGRDTALGDRLEQLDDDLGQATAQLAAAKAWRSALSRMTAVQVQALQAYRDNLANVGKGTGKYAERYRQAARSAMQVAQEAVPAWVMPLQQVLASIPPRQNSFDVVIVDEASQADITSLFLLWLAPRVIVVGDDKQCTPSEVSAGALDKVFDRLDAYLGDMPLHLRATLTPRSSIFSMLRTRFGQVVRLREHFRCMPEIITWSSQMFYRDAPLIPVRQFGADRLPPLRASYVPGGYNEGQYSRLNNPVEAQAIVETIETCLQDPAYDDKTFGVVVLQGHAQADVIRNALLQRIPSDVWDERRLRIGTPPDFQGDERHVVFLSMVVAPERRFATLTKNEYQRRFNVAASRAQDQLWLFHSVTPDRLSPQDLRHSLLTYLQAASSSPVGAMPAGVTRDRRHPDFDSLFEQRVFLDLVDRGYHVTPQVEVNGRRIDLVVTGRGSKLAVECDGDAWHTSAEQMDSDLARELELKRCGWTFWRVRESEYYLDSARALHTLWPALDELGIGPLQPADPGAAEDESAGAWTPPQLPDDESPILDDEPADTEFPGEESPPAVSITEYTSTTAAEPPAAVGGTRPYRRMSIRSETEAKQAILRLASERGPLSNADIRAEIGLEGHQVRELLSQLIRDGLVYRTGAKRGTRYHVGSHNQPGDEYDSWM